jgi:alpha-glucosidase
LKRVDYLKWLGVSAVWITPFYHSPLRDLGYDVADFCNVDPVFGSLEDFDRLLDELHARGIHLIIDFVPNHTSDQHPWFTESRSSRTNGKQDWYLWADPSEGGGPPNNWLSRFGHSAWQWEEKRQQYYYHSFLLEQPDLNWSNPAVRDAMGNVLRFWLDRGVDGFRVDASAVMAKDPLMRDNPPEPNCSEATPPPRRWKPIFTDDRPQNMEYLEYIRSVVEEYDERVLAGEVQGTVDRIGHFYGNSRPRLHLPLNFALHDSLWDALSLQANIDAYFNAIPSDGWPDWVIGGHDKPRITRKIGQAQARVLAMLLFTLRGTPFFFAGDEIGMEPVPIPADRIHDPFEKLVPGYGLSRDPQRSPMRWDSNSTGGFTTGEPWLPMGHDVTTRNVGQLQADPKSLLWLYRSLIELRQREAALRIGDFHPLRSRNDVLMFERQYEQDRLFVALNIVDQPRKCIFSERGRQLLSTFLDGDVKTIDGAFLLRADEGVIIKLNR